MKRTRGLFPNPYTPRRLSRPEWQSSPLTAYRLPPHLPSGATAYFSSHLHSHTRFTRFTSNFPFPHPVYPQISIPLDLRALFRSQPPHLAVIIIISRLLFAPFNVRWPWRTFLSSHRRPTRTTFGRDGINLAICFNILFHKQHRVPRIRFK